MRANFSTLKYVCAICCLAATSWLTITTAQTKTVWVLVSGTYNVETLDKIEDIPVSTTAGAFSSNDYNDAVADITSLSSRVFKFGGSVFTMPVGYKATELAIYGWPRKAGTSTLNSIEINGVNVATFDDENPSPYVFADCGADVAPGNRTKSNCSIFKINEVSETNPVTSTFKVGIAGETHAFCKILLVPAGSTGINNIQLDETGEKEYYDLTGRKVINPTNGVYICNGKKKIVTNQ